MWIILLTYSTAYAQDGRYTLGARSGGLANASLTIADGWSVFNNPGALGSVTRSSFFAGYQSRYSIAGFNVIGGGAVFHQPKFNTGVKFFKFGDDLYSQQLAGFALANRFHMVSLGLGVNVIQTAAEGLMTRRVWVMELGGRAEITDQLLFGAHIFNLKHGVHYPATMKAGLSFRPMETLRINTEIEKQLEQASRFRSGIEYRPIARLTVRTGVDIQSGQVQQCFGFGLQPADFLIDYAFATTNLLGIIHEISIGYLLRQP